MKESSTYQAILAEGREEGIRNTILLIGNNRFGKPSGIMLALLTAIHSLPRLEVLSERLLEVETWDELFA